MFKKLKNNRFILALSIVVFILALTAGIVLSGITDAYFTDNDGDSVGGRTGKVGLTLSNIETPFAESADLVEDMYWGSYTSLNFDVENNGSIALDTNTTITINSEDEVDWEAFSEAFLVYWGSDVEVVNDVYTVKDGAVPIPGRTILENGIRVELPESSLSGASFLEESQPAWKNSDGECISNSEYHALSALEKLAYSKCSDVTGYDLVFAFGEMEAEVNMTITVHTDGYKAGNSTGWAESDEFVRYGKIAYNPYHNMLEDGIDFNASLMQLAGVDTGSAVMLMTADLADDGEEEKTPPSLMNLSSYPIASYTVHFTDVDIPEGVSTLDVSYAKDGSVRAWVDTSKTTIYVVTVDKGAMKANEDCSYMFANWNGPVKFGENFNSENTIDMSYMFRGYNYYTSTTDAVDFTNVDTSNVETMDHMFAQSYATFTPGEFNTDKVTDMQYMFYYAYINGTVELNTENVTNMAHMFDNASSGYLEIDVFSFNTSKVTDMSYMFRNSYSIFHYVANATTFDFTSWDVSNVENMTHMFEGNKSYQAKYTINVSNWNASKCLDMSYMFANNFATNGNQAWYGMNGLNVSGMKTDSCTDMSYMFYYCGIVTSLDCSSFNTSNVTNMAYMFAENRNTYSSVPHVGYGLQTLNISSFDTSKVTNMSHMFYDTGLLTSLDVSHFDTSSCTDMSYMFGCVSRVYNGGSYGITSLDVSNFDTSNVTNMAGMFYDMERVATITIGELFNTSKVTDMSYMFSNCGSLKTIDVSGFDTSACTKMQYMFNGTGYITTLDVSGFNTSNVTNMAYMFAGLNTTSYGTTYGPTVLDVSGFDTRKVTDMQSMFSSCKRISVIDVSGFTTDLVTNMANMFSNCQSVKELDVSNFNTSKVTDMSWMFYYCKNVPEFNVNHFDVSKVTATDYMFKGCVNSNFKRLDLSNWNFENNFTAVSMFSGGDTNGEYMKLRYIIANDWSDKITSSNNMFKDCSSLVGDNRSYSSSNVSSAMANPETGYFSALPEDTTNMLIDGMAFSTAFPSNTTAVIFTNVVDDSFTLTDLSYKKDGSVVGWSNGTTFYVSTLDGSKVIAHPKSREMFNGGYGQYLTKIDVTCLDASNINDATYMFHTGSSYRLVSIVGISDWDVSNLAVARYMFYGFGNSTLDLSGWNTESLTDTSYMFASSRCPAIKGIENFDMRKCITAEYMFNNMDNIKYLDLSDWKFEKSFNAYSMFGGCDALLRVKLLNWTLPSTVTKTDNMFGASKQLYYVYAGDWTANTTASSSTGMFSNSGLNGVVSSSAAQWSYAKPQPDGYFFDINTARNNVLVRGESFRYIVPSGTTSIVFDSTLEIPENKTLYDLSEGWDGSVVGWLDGTKFYVSTKDNGTIYLNESCKYMFNISGLTSVDMGDVNDSLVTNTSYMFTNCSSLANIDFADLTFKNVTDMSYMFYYCSNLQVLDLTNFDVSKVTTTANMFYYCYNMTTVYAGDWTDVTTPTNSSGMFNNCYLLAGGKAYNASYMTWAMADTNGYFMAKPTDTDNMLAEGVVINAAIPTTVTKVAFINTVADGVATTDLSYGKDGSVVGWLDGTTYYIATIDGGEIIAHPSCAYMFYNKTALTTTDFSNLNTDNVINLAYMFNGCTKLTTPNVENINTKNVVTMRQMFSNCKALKELNLPWDVSSLQSTYGMFYYCESLLRIKLTSWEPVLIAEADQMFYLCSALSTIAAGDWTDMETPKSSNNMFYGCGNLTGAISYNSSYQTWAYANTKTGYFMGSGEDNRLAPTKVLQYAIPTTATSITFDSTLAIPEGVKLYDLSARYDGSVVGWFNGTKFYISSVNGEEIIMKGDYSNAFQNRSSLTSFDFGDLNTSGLTSMYYMFYNCSSMTSFKCENLDTSKVTNMYYIFGSCTKLTELDLRGWDVSKVTNMAYMFSYCTNLQLIDLSSWNISSLTNTSYMFYYCSNLTTIYAGDWTAMITTTPSSSNMFYYCSKLTGAISYNSSYKTWAYANTTTGYFSVKSNESNVLAQGQYLRYKIPTTATSIVFDKSLTAPSSAIDLSDARDRSVLGWLSGTTYYITSADGEVIRLNKNSMNTFRDRTALKTVDFSDADASLVKNTSYMFYGCSALTSLDLTCFKNSDVVNTTYMFYGCTTLTDLDLSEWNMSNVTNTSYMFYNCKAVTLLDLNKWDMSKVTNATYMFYNCTSLVTIYGQDWTASTTTAPTSTYMFTGCTKLVGNIAFNSSYTTWAYANTDQYFTSKFVMPNALVKGSTFNSLIPTNATSIVFDNTLAIPDGVELIDVSDAGDGTVVGWLVDTTFYVSTTNGETMYLHQNAASMFKDNATLTSIDFASIDTSLTTKTSYMFSGCTGLKDLNLSKWDTTSLADISYMFYNCTSLLLVDMTDWNVAEVTNANSMFNGCSTLTTVYAGDWSTVTTPTDSADMFTDCSTIYGYRTYSSSCVDWAYANTTSGYFVTKPEESNVLIQGQFLRYAIPNTVTSVTFDASLTAADNAIDLSAARDGSVLGWLDDTNYYITSTDGNMMYMPSAARYMFYNKSAMVSIDLTSVSFEKVVQATSMFYGCAALSDIDFANWNVSNVTHMTSMFYGCTALKEVDLTSWSPTSLAYTATMFRGCTSLKSVNLSNWNTPVLNSVANMFYGCTSLDTINFNGWSTSTVTLMTSMFNGCTALETVDLSGLDVSNVTTTTQMFRNCTALKTVNLSGWNTAKLRTISYMFYGCTALETVDMSGWNVASVTNASQMFRNCSALTTIYAGDWASATTTAPTSTAMFTGCTNLVGAIPFDSTCLTWDYANTTTGYFTVKPVAEEGSGEGTAATEPTTTPEDTEATEPIEVTE